MRRQEKVAVTFAPYVAIAELENTLALNRNMHVRCLSTILFLIIYKE